MTTHSPLGALTCDEVEPLLPLVADGQLDEAGDPALFAHLADCPHCADSLAAHDLITLTLERQPTTAAAARSAVRMTSWQRWLPLAAAATLVVGLGLALGSGMQSTAPAPLAAANKPRVAHPAMPAPAAAPAAPSVPIQIDMEVVALPGSTPGHPRYLVRRGEQVLLVDPTAAPADALPASYSTNPSHEHIRRY